MGSYCAAQTGFEQLIFLPPPLKYTITGMLYHPSLCLIVFSLPLQPLPVPAPLSPRLISLWLSRDLSETQHLRVWTSVWPQTDKIQLCLPTPHTPNPQRDPHPPIPEPAYAAHSCSCPARPPEFLVLIHHREPLLGAEMALSCPQRPVQMSLPL